MTALHPKAANEKYCSECGAVIRQAAEICPHCGVRQFAPPTSVIASHSRITAALFALLLGGLGIHKFYLGRIGAGVIYLLFCWTFIPSLISLIEGISYLTMTDAQFTQKYG